MFCLSPSTLWKNIYTIFYVSLLQKYMYLPRLTLVQNYVESSTFHICERIHDNLPYFFFMNVFFIHSIFAEDYVQSSIFYIVEEDIILFHISFMLKYIYLPRFTFAEDFVKSSTFHTLKYIYSSTFNFCRSLVLSSSVPAQAQLD